jgi:hypothetical protein
MKGVNMTYDVMTLNNIGTRLPCTCDVHEYKDWARLPITSIEVYAMDMIAFQAYTLDTCNHSDASRPKTIRLNSIVLCNVYVSIMTSSLLRYDRLHEKLTPISKQLHNYF